MYLKCSKCFEEKDSSHFCKNKQSKRGFRYECRACGVRLAREWKEKNPDRQKKNMLEWRKNNIEHRNNYKKKWAAENPEKARAQKRRFYEKHRTKIIAKSCANDKKNRSKVYERYKKWRDKNREKIKERTREWHKNRAESDPHYRIAACLRANVRGALKKAGVWKSERTATLVGCSVVFLKGYLEAKFKPGMHWGLKGKIHIDHIRPISSFDLTDIEQQKICFHYTNLQPLWWDENIRKSDAMPKSFQPSFL